MKRSIIAAVIIIAAIIRVAVAAQSPNGKPELVEFHRIEADVTGFHEINAAEEVGDGCIYFAGDKLVYMRNDVAVEVADNVSSLWRDGETVRRIAEDEYMYSVADLDVVGSKAYIRYYTGLEDMGTAGLIVQL